MAKNLVINAIFVGSQAIVKNAATKRIPEKEKRARKEEAEEEEEAGEEVEEGVGKEEKEKENKKKKERMEKIRVIGWSVRSLLKPTDGGWGMQEEMGMEI